MKTQLIINADDFGLAESVNLAVLDAFTAGNVSSTTMMVNMPAAEHAAAIAEAHPGLAVGLHFTLTEGPSLTGHPGLRSADGQPLPRSAFLKRWLTRRLDSAAIRRELEAQLDRLARLGIEPTHVDGHQHIHTIPGVFDAMLPILKERRLPVRTVRPPRSLHPARRTMERALKQTINRAWATQLEHAYGRTVTNCLVSIHDLPMEPGAKLHDSVYATLLDPLSGATAVELMVHPYRPDKQLAASYGSAKAPFLNKCYEEWRLLKKGPCFDAGLFELVNFQSRAEVQITQGKEADTAEMSALLLGDDDPHSAEWLRHWFFDNPTRHFDIRVARQTGEMVGVATANCLGYSLANRTTLVAMPQKVVTSTKVRGRGVFRQLYEAVEESLFADPAVDMMLTVTNEMSTPIFLNRLGYVRVPSPDVYWLAPSPRKQTIWKCLTDALEGMDTLASGTQLPGAPHKNPSYFAWRYRDASERGYRIYARRRSNGTAEALCFGERTQRGVRFLVLLDAFGVKPEDAPSVLRDASRIAWQERTAGLLLLKNVLWQDPLTRHRLAVRAPTKFNVLVKGRTDHETADWAKQEFNFSFGDWDFM